MSISRRPRSVAASWPGLSRWATAAPSSAPPTLFAGPAPTSVPPPWPTSAPKWRCKAALEQLDATERLVERFDSEYGRVRDALDHLLAGVH